MRPPEEMPAYLETVSSSQQQASPYPDPYINQQQTPHPEQPQVIVQTGCKCLYVCVCVCVDWTMLDGEICL